MSDPTVAPAPPSAQPEPKAKVKAPKIPVPTEKETERAVKDLYRKMGLKVWSLSQGFRPGLPGGGHATTRQTKGIADLFVTGRGKAAWHEVKRPGRIRPAQLKKQEDQRFFEEAVTACGLPYAFGGIGAAMLALRDVWGIGLTPMVQEPDRLTLPKTPTVRPLLEPAPRTSSPE